MPHGDGHYYRRLRRRSAPRRRRVRSSRFAGLLLAFVLGMIFLFVIVPLIEKAIMMAP